MVPTQKIIHHVTYEAVTTQNGNPTEASKQSEDSITVNHNAGLTTTLQHQVAPVGRNRRMLNNLV